MHFAEKPNKYSQFHQIYRSGRVEGQRIAPEFLDPLNVRFIQVNEQESEHLKWLR